MDDVDHEVQEIRCEQFWPMLREIRGHCQKTGHAVMAVDSPQRRIFGFWSPEANKMWVISLTKLSLTAKLFDANLDGNPLTVGDEEVLWRYVHLLNRVDGRKVIAEALSVGVHPTQELVDQVRYPYPRRPDAHASL